MKILSTTYAKVTLIVIISVLLYSLWLSGMELIYTRLLVGTTNIGLGIVKNDTHIELELNDSKYQFKVRTRIEGRMASFPQETGSLLQPFVIVMSWQIFLFFVLKRRDALRSLGANVLIFVLFQALFLICLTGFYTSSFQKFLYELIKDSFYVIAVALIIKDNMLYPVFKKIA